VHNADLEVGVPNDGTFTACSDKIVPKVWVPLHRVHGTVVLESLDNTLEHRIDE